MTKLKTFIKSHRVFVNVLGFLFFLVCATLCLYTCRYELSSLSPSVYCRILFSSFFVTEMARIFVDFPDLLKERKNRISSEKSD